MYMNLKPNNYKRISFNTTTMTSLWFIGPPPKIGGPPNYFGLKFLGPPLKLGGGGGGAAVGGRAATIVNLNVRQDFEYPMESETSCYRKDYEKNCTMSENKRTTYQKI